MREKEIKSVVSKKYINKENHNIPFVIYGNRDSIIVYKDWWDKIDQGDSIIKPKGSLELIIKNPTKFERFNFEERYGLK